MVGGVFSHLGAAGNPATQNAQNDTGDGENHKNQENRLLLVEIKQVAHPRDHGSEELTDQGKQGCNNGRGRSLKSSPFQKIFWKPVTDAAGEPT